MSVEVAVAVVVAVKIANLHDAHAPDSLVTDYKKSDGGKLEYSSM